MNLPRTGIFCAFAPIFRQDGLWFDDFRMTWELRSWWSTRVVYLAARPCRMIGRWEARCEKDLVTSSHLQVRERFGRRNSQFLSIFSHAARLSQVFRLRFPRSHESNQVAMVCMCLSASHLLKFFDSYLEISQKRRLDGGLRTWRVGKGCGFCGRFLWF